MVRLKKNELNINLNEIVLADFPSFLKKIIATKKHIILVIGHTTIQSMNISSLSL